MVATIQNNTYERKVDFPTSASPNSSTVTSGGGIVVSMVSMESHEGTGGFQGGRILAFVRVQCSRLGGGDTRL